MIGIIDSGFGGLSVVAELLRQDRKLPFVYIGDNARNPYGTKTKTEIITYAEQMVDYLIEQHQIDTLFIACNTICAAAISELTAKYTELHIEAITNYGASGALMSFDGQVTVLATKFTVESNLYADLIETYDETISTQQLIAQDFVKMVEEDYIDIVKIKAILREINAETDTIILGCTHFPFLYDTIRKLIDKSVQIIDPAVAMVASCDYTQDELWMQKSLYLSTGDTTSFTNFLKKQNLFFKELPIKQITLK